MRANSLGLKVGLGYASMMIVLALAAGITIWQVSRVTKTADRIKNLRSPTAQSSLTMLCGLNRSLTALRGWMFLVTFAYHNLVLDSVFGEMNLIVCRNVLIYFDKMPQNRVLRLFRDSLCHRGFLCLGSKESLDYSDVGDQFEPVSQNERVYQQKEETCPIH